MTLRGIQSQSKDYQISPESSSIRISLFRKATDTRISKPTKNITTIITTDHERGKQGHRYQKRGQRYRQL